MIAYQLFLVLQMDEYSIQILSLVSLPMYYRWELLGLTFANLIISFIYEKFFIGWLNFKMQIRNEKKR